jgi:uncharacterized repeat protein (TIGR03803 family)
MYEVFQRCFSFVKSAVARPPELTNGRSIGSFKGLAVLGALWAFCSPVAQGQTSFRVLSNFNVADGSAPRFVSLVQGTDGNLWGTTAAGGTGCTDCGTIYKISPSGTLSVVYNLNESSGYDPAVGLTLSTSGDFYGVGGLSAGGFGTVFKITGSGALTVLRNFDNTNGNDPEGALTQGTDGNFYGTTNFGGSDDVGTVFKITPGGTLTTLQSFDVDNGAYPYGQLVQGTDGSFYGVTEEGGDLECSNGGCGTVFKITPGGVFTLLHSFSGSDGEFPVGGLVQGENGDFYGTTMEGGAFSIGTVFEITSSDTFTSLLSFGGANEGGEPLAPLIQATDGNFYGTTYYGTVFQLTPAGGLRTMFAFSDGKEDGQSPEGGLVQDTNGTFYGVTYRGGQYDHGVVYSLNTGLGPFVKTLPPFGTAGAAVKILGTNLTGATSVTFDGVVATFTVVSSSLITTTVPTGATNGKVQVVTPGGTLTSNVPFRVLP